MKGNRKYADAVDVMAHLEATSLTHLGSMAEVGTKRAAKQADFTTCGR